MADILTLQCFSQIFTQNIRIILCPFRYFNITYPLLKLSQPKIVPININHHFWQHKNLRNKLSYISWRICRICPWSNITRKHTVSAIEFSALQSDSADWERSQSYQIIEDDRRWGVMGTKMILRKYLVFTYVTVFI